MKQSAAETVWELPSDLGNLNPFGILVQTRSLIPQEDVEWGKHNSGYGDDVNVVE